MKLTSFALLLLGFLSYGCRTGLGLSVPQVNYQGNFESMEGVFDPISCYCSNGGYVQTEAGEVIPVCLRENEEINCESVSVSGIFVLKEASDEPTSPCPTEKKKVLMVQRIICR